MAINISVRYKLFFKWTVLVWLNAAFSFFGKNTEILDILSIVCGVFTFVGIYTVIDYYLIKIQAIQLRKLLFNTVLLKALTQFYPVIEIWTVIVSTVFIKDIGLNNIPFISTYLITLTDGILLSIVVAFVVTLFIIIAKLFAFIIRRFKYPIYRR